jgi:hypothetical protein
MVLLLLSDILWLIFAVQPIILIEFNELCPALLDRWMAEGRLPNFKRFYDASQVYVTEADVSEPVNLEPWIQWYSLHTGLPFSDHGVFHLTDGPKAGHRDIWTLLLEHGHSVFNCGSMNAARLDHSRSTFIPDPWCAGEPAHPHELQPFVNFVSHQVQEYTNRDAARRRTEALSFLGFMVGHGLSRDTVAATLRQLLDEYRTGGRVAWRRAAFLDKLQLDLFSHVWRRQRPDFSTFFVNSTAHFQHAYWRHMAPEAFAVKPPRDEVERYQDAIAYGYAEMDRLLARFFALEAQGARLVFATALSQQPYLKYEAIGGHHFYRPRNITRFLADLGLDPVAIKPVMTHQFLVEFATPEECERAHAKLAAVTCDGSPVFGFDPADGNSLYFGSQIRVPVPQNAELQIGNRSRPYWDVFYKIDELKSGRHHPDGCLWFKTGRHDVCAEKVSILDVLPTIAAAFRIAPPTRHGRALFDWGGDGAAGVLAARETHALDQLTA